MPFKAFCDNCSKSFDNFREAYGIIFVMPSENVMRPKEIQKMLCQECFIDFYQKAGFQWVDKIATNGKN